MRFALFTHMAWPEKTNQKQLIDETIQQVILGEDLGFYSAWIAEHHFSRYGIGSSPLVVTSAIAAQTNRIRLGTAVLVPPLHNPIRIAEDTATVDLISNGRLDVGFGRGSAAYEYNGYQIDQGQSQEMFIEGIKVINGLWTTSNYSHHGRYYKVSQATLVPRPVQQPHPPVYVAASRRPQISRFIISTGYPICIGVVSDTNNALTLCREFVEMSENSGGTITMSRIPFFRYCYVAETVKQVRDDTQAHLEWATDMVSWRATFKVDSEVNHQIEDWRNKRTEEAVNPDHIYKNRAVMGTPEEVVAQLKTLQSQGIEYFGCNFSFGGMSHENIMKSMELFSREVMPKFSGSLI